MWHRCTRACCDDPRRWLLRGTEAAAHRFAASHQAISAASASLTRLTHTPHSHVQGLGERLALLLVLLGLLRGGIVPAGPSPADLGFPEGAAKADADATVAAIGAWTGLAIDLDMLLSVHLRLRQLYSDTAQL